MIHGGLFSEVGVTVSDLEKVHRKGYVPKENKPGDTIAVQARQEDNTSEVWR